MRKGPFRLLAMLALGGCISPSFFNLPTQEKLSSPVGNRNPIIKALEAHRFERAPNMATLWAIASDPDGDPLSISWSTTEGLLSSTAGTEVKWSATATKSAAYVVTVQANISDGRGGTTSGALNLNMGADGTPLLPLEATASMPTPDPVPPSQGQTTSSPSPSTHPITFQGLVSWRGEGSNLKIGVYRIAGRNDFYNRLMNEKESHFTDLHFEATATPDLDGHYTIEGVDNGEQYLALLIKCWDDKNKNGYFDAGSESGAWPPCYAFCRAPDDPMDDSRWYLDPGYYLIRLGAESVSGTALIFDY